MATLAIENLFDKVSQAFDDASEDIVMRFGWREPVKHKKKESRIVWIPGDQNNVGDLVAPRGLQSTEVRKLAQVNERFTIEIAGFDPTDPTNERKQYRATRDLFDLWYKTAYKIAHGTFYITSLNWNDERRELAHGFEIIAVIEIETPIFDDCYTLATAEEIDGEIEMQDLKEEIDITL